MKIVQYVRITTNAKLGFSAMLIGRYLPRSEFACRTQVGRGPSTSRLPNQRCALENGECLDDKLL